MFLAYVFLNAKSADLNPLPPPLSGNLHYFFKPSLTAEGYFVGGIPKDYLSLHLNMILSPIKTVMETVRD